MPRRHYREADLRAMIPLYLDGALTPAERAAVEEYWQAHPELLGQFAEATRLIDLLDEAVTAPPAPDGFTAEVMAEITRLRPAQRFRQVFSLHAPLERLRWLAEAALLLMLGWLLVTHPWAPRVESIELQMHGSERWTLGQPAALRLIARDRLSGRPLVSGDVAIRLQGQRWRQTVFRARTNDQGTVDASLRLPDRLAPGRYTIVAEVSAPVGRATVWHRVSLQQRPTVRLEVLNPTAALGTELVARVEVLESDGSPSQRPVVWRLTDEQGDWLAGSRRLATQGGQAFLRAPLAAEAHPGPATLWAGVDGGPMSYAPVQLVPAVPQDLVLRVTADPEPGSAEVLVTTAHGAPVASAPVRASLAGRLGSVSPVTRVTDAAGRAEFGFPVGPAGGERVLTATARLADGRGGATASAVRWPDERLEVRLTNTAEAVGGVPNRLTLSLAGAPAPDWQGTARLTLNGVALKPVALDAPTLPVRLVPRTGWNRLDVHLRHADRREWSRSIRFWAADPRQSLRLERLPNDIVDDDSLDLQVIGATTLRRVYLDLFQRGELVLTRSLAMRQGTGQLRLQVPSGLTGPCVLSAYGRSGSRWLKGQMQFTPSRSPQPELEIGMAEGAVEVGAPPGSTVLVAATRPAVPEPFSPAPGLAAYPGYTLVANSVPVSQSRAIAAQQRFFARSKAVGAGLAFLIMIALTAWAYQQMSDPLEVIGRDERRRFGRLPRVHQRRTMAGLGAITTGVALAIVVGAGVLQAGNQARELASQSGKAARYLGGPTVSPGQIAARQVQAALPRLTVGPSSPDLAAEIRTWDSTQTPALPTDRTAEWRLTAWVTAPGGATVRGTTTVAETGEPAIMIQDPGPLRVGEQIVVPVRLANPTADRLPVAVTAAVESGLELTVPPTQRVIVDPKSELALTIGLRAAEYGDGCLTVSATGLRVAASDTVAIPIWPPAPRTDILSTGWLETTHELPLEIPAGASARRLDIECLQEPLELWTSALRTAADRPARGFFEAVAEADALALALRLGRRSRRLGASDDARLVADVQRALQRLTAAALRGPDGQPTGAFQAAGEAPSDLFTTAFALLVLRRIDRFVPVDPLLLAQCRAALRATVQTRLATSTDPTDQPAWSGPVPIAAAALALTDGSPEDQAVVDAVLDRLSEQLGLLPDSLSLAWTAAALVYARPRQEATAQALERLAALRYQRSDGSNWYPGARATPAGATGRGAALEVTALAAAAFGQADRLPEVRDEGLAYLAGQPLPDGTWGDAYLTALVVRAQLAADDIPAAAQGTVALTLDDEPLGEATFDGTTPDLHVRQTPTPGTHLLKLRFTGRGRVAWRARLAYSQSGPLNTSDGLTLTVQADRTRLRPGDRLPLTLRVTNPATTPAADLFVTLPVPAGFRCIEHPTAGPAIPLAVGSLPPGGTQAVHLTLQALPGRAETVGRPVTVRALRDPGRLAQAALPPLEIL